MVITLCDTCFRYWITNYTIKLNYFNCLGNFRTFIKFKKKTLEVDTHFLCHLA